MRLFLKKIGEHYERLFSVGEIRETPALQWFMGGSLLFFLLAFSTFINSPTATVEGFKSGQTICWPYFQGCGKFFFLHDGLTDHSRGIFYMLLFTIILAAVWAMSQKRWGLAHSLTLLLFLWEAPLTMAFAYSSGPYFYYHIFLTAILLFVPFKEYFLRITFVLFYFLSATTKFNDGWILGTYFSSLKAGLPLFPDTLIPLFTNLVILSQVVLCWFLLSNNKRLQRGSLVFFIAFHLYSGIFVSYLFPVVTLAPLIIFFGLFNRPVETPRSLYSLPGWGVILLLLLFQSVSFLIPGDRRLTLEGDQYGMFMFEANHQCRIHTEVYSSGEGAEKPFLWSAVEGSSCGALVCPVSLEVRRVRTTSVRTSDYESHFSQYRCDPYEWWTRLKEQCQGPEVARATLRIDHSINGGPYYRIVDEGNVCRLDYKPFSKNAWIKEPPEAPVVGYPVKNAYHY